MENREKNSYSIHEVAKKYNLNTWTIRFWANHINLLKPRQNQKGDILFAPEDVHKIGLISHLTNVEGVALQDVGRYIF